MELMKHALEYLTKWDTMPSIEVDWLLAWVYKEIPEYGFGNLPRCSDQWFRYDSKWFILHRHDETWMPKNRTSSLDIILKNDLPKNTRWSVSQNVWYGYYNAYITDPPITGELPNSYKATSDYATIALSAAILRYRLQISN